ncbi:MAG: septum formation initiator family protein [Verrucomicrobiales bacterium]|nr:septum formation initiator family protein [Verrucomicrobiales bacterium]
MMRDPDFTDQPEFTLHASTAAAMPSRSSLWKRLSRLMEVVIYALLVLAVVKLFDPELQRRDELALEKQRLEVIRDEKESQVVRLRQEHRLLKTDKDYLETIARDRLNLQREGEHVIRIQRDGEE